MESCRLATDLSGDHGRTSSDLTGVNANVIVPAYAGTLELAAHPHGAAVPIWPGTDKVLVVGDWDGDGYVDAMAPAVRRRMWLYPGHGVGQARGPVGRLEGLGPPALITPVGDFDGDGLPDLMAQVAARRHLPVPGARQAGFKTPRHDALGPARRRACGGGWTLGPATARRTSSCRSRTATSSCIPATGRAVSTTR